MPPDFELAGEMADAPEVLSRGGSAIIGPDGKFLTGPVYDQEGVFCAEIDLERLLEEKQTLDVVGHYARPEVFKLTVNSEPFTSYQLGEEFLKQELARLEALAEEAPREVLREALKRLRERLTRPAES